MIVEPGPTVPLPSDGRRRAARRAALAVAVLALLLVAGIWFRPDRLVVDDVVKDAAPAGAGARALVAAGELRSLDHHTSGTVEIVDTDAGRVVRIVGLDTSNGPDLYVYLSPNPADGPEPAFDDGHLDLGRLRGNRGDANYAVPAGVDLAAFRSVVIWCDRFDSAFGAADLA